MKGCPTWIKVDFSNLGDRLFYCLKKRRVLEQIIASMIIKRLFFDKVVFSSIIQ